MPISGFPHLQLKACPKCHGDLSLDEGDWLCLQCGRYRYTGLYRNTLPGQKNTPASFDPANPKSGSAFAVQPTNHTAGG